MNLETIRKYLPHIAVGFVVLYFGFSARPRTDAADDFQYREFGRLPVLSDGRYKPMDTVARNNLMIITHRQDYYDAKAGKYYSANKWLLDVMTSPAERDPVMKFVCPNGAAEHPAWKYEVFRIENDQLLRELGLDMRERLRYSINELNHKIEFIEGQAHRIRNIPAKDRSLFDAKLMELYQHMHLCMEVSSMYAPRVVPDPEENQPWKPFRVAFMDMVEKIQSGEAEDPQTEETVKVYMDLLRSYDASDKEGFNKKLAAHLDKLDRQSPVMMKMLKLERFFNEFAPFYHCLALYVAIALLGGLSWFNLAWSTQMRRAAYAAMVVAFLVHTAAIIMRIYLQGRPPVTNLYSSAIFIGWGCVAICLAVEWIYANGIAIVAGSVSGFCTLIIAHILSLDGDTMVMMQAVLDTNFWLATHVTCITLGYTTTFVAGAMGIAYILLGIFTDKLRKDGSANLTRMTYGVLCTGMFLSFVGTVLGGLWADYSWGRFWGWDPKENGALLIVIWIALILHARWGGMIKHRGIAVLSVLGIIVTSWSWFGTNFLGLGLHAYGGAKGTAMQTLAFIDFAFLSIAGLGALLPLEMWQSFRPPAPPSNVEPPKLNISAKSTAKMA
jgi:ABC-type transport system involved in cytochrome c biogenesis permease subunit